MQALEASRAAAGAGAPSSRFQPLVREADKLQWPGMLGHLINDAYGLPGLDTNLKCLPNGLFRATASVPGCVRPATRTVGGRRQQVLKEVLARKAELFWPYGIKAYWWTKLKGRPEELATMRRVESRKAAARARKRATAASR